MNERYRTVVLRRHVWHRYLMVAALLLALLIALGLGWMLGHGRAVESIGVNSGDLIQLRNAQVALQHREQQLQEQLAIRDGQRDVDLAALELVRTELVEKGQEIRELQEALDFFRSFIAPEQLAEGLSVRNLELVASSTAHRYQFRLLVLHKSSRGGVLEGRLRLQLEGLQHGETREFDFAKFSDQVPTEGLKLRFRYFQLLEGIIDLPPDFYPKRVKLLATARRPRKSEVSAEYAWQIQEDFVDVGK